MSSAPMAPLTAANHSGSMVAEVPMMGIILPPFKVLNSPRKVPADPIASVKMTSGWYWITCVTSVR